MSTATNLIPLSTGGPLTGRVALVTGGTRGIDESAYITGQIWSVNGGLDM